MLVTPTSGETDVPAAGTAVVLAAAGTLVRKVTVSSPLANTGALTIGSTKALAEAGSGISLDPGQSHTFDESTAFEERTIDLNDLWIDVTTNGDDVTYFYFT
jgi:hypothetical protein